MIQLNPNGFDIAIDFAGSWTETLKSAFLRAAALIERVVAGDLPDEVVWRPDGGATVVDDLLIRAELPAMDGAGGWFGSAGPDLLRGDSLLPITADMRFDAEDAATLEARGLWDEVVLHEMLHTLGVGTLWLAKGLLTADGVGYVGAAGLAEYAAMGGSGAVPVETEGGAGTAGLHWAESVFGAELMTGWLDADGRYLGALTLASLSDLGYALAPRPGWAADAVVMG